VVKAELPTATVLDQADVEILDLLLSFEAWSRLRLEQGLSSAEAREALKSAVMKVTEDRALFKRG
jgi:hypothetical protein